MATYKKWTESEIEYIRANHVNTPDEVIAANLTQITSGEVSTAMVRRQRRKLKLSKPQGRPSKVKASLARDSLMGGIRIL